LQTSAESGLLIQEKVVEFSKMTPEELLINTERAIDDAKLFDMHNKLISGGKELNEKQIDMCASNHVQLCTAALCGAHQCKHEHDTCAHQPDGLSNSSSLQRRRESDCVWDERLRVLLS
jgi:hypothetical protein